MKRLLSLLVALLLAYAPFASAALIAEDDDEMASVTFDNLLGADSYMLYGELRNVGAQVQAGGIISLFEPLMPLIGGMPKELAEINTFILKNSSTLARSRMMFAAMPIRQGLPQALVAVELASPDAAAQFEPEFRRFLSSLMSEASRVSPAPPALAEQGRQSPFFIKRAGALLIVSDSEFQLKSVRPEEGDLLSSDLNFQAARNRLYSEPLFVYFNVGLNERMIRERFESTKTDVERIDVEKDESEKGDSQPPPDAVRSGEEPVTSEATSLKQPSDLKQPSGTLRKSRKGRASKTRPSKADQVTKADRTRSLEVSERAANERAANERAANDAVAASGRNEASPGAHANAEQDFISSSLLSMLIGGSGIQESPASVALALAYEADALVVRIMLADEPGAPAAAIPFISVMLCGPPVAPEAASYVPADTEIFLTASLDLPKMFDLLLAMGGGVTRASAPKTRKQNEQPAGDSEKKTNAKLRDDLFAALGSEVAFSISARSPLLAPFFGRLPAQPNQNGAALLIAVQNKEVVKAKMLPALEAIGLKARSEKGVTEKRGNFEISSYGRVSVALINNFLVLTSDLPSMRRIVDAVSKNQTLATTRDYHDYMRWQPRQTLAQVYVSSAVIKSFYDSLRDSAGERDEEMKRFFEEYSPVPEPVTYAAMSDAAGPVYELRLPKGLVSLVMAGLNSDAKRSLIAMNESTAITTLTGINHAQSLYRNEHGKFATLDELEAAGLAGNESLNKFGYRFELSVAGSRYELFATPLEYGKTGRTSFYIDETGVIKGGDHEGRPATSADKSLGGRGKN